MPRLLAPQPTEIEEDGLLACYLAGSLAITETTPPCLPLPLPLLLILLRGCLADSFDWLAALINTAKQEVSAGRSFIRFIIAQLVLHQTSKRVQQRYDSMLTAANASSDSNLLATGCLLGCVAAGLLVTCE